MPVILNISSPEGHRIGLWEITEPESALLSPLNLNEKEAVILARFSNQARRLQWLGVRNLLKEFGVKGSIEYTSSGKPYLIDKEEHISVSHSGKYAAISLNKKGATGIDIEEINPRILKIAERFTSHEEKAYLKEEIMVEQLCLIWGAKEVLFKMSEWIPPGQETSGISFKDNFLVRAFIPTESGSLETLVKKGDIQQHVMMEYRKTGNYYLVYSKNSEL